ncbi:sperm-associated antigen 4 [Haematobia irritans]|uniref:sperm-associated antigen 4 n=1 Tax=Haematobia irritans TaxID=7368 RepID=UPI003F509A67
MLELYNIRICVCYVITTCLISVFVYSQISNNIQNTRKIERLREDVDEIAHLVLRTPASGRDSYYHISDMVDNMLKKRLTGIWEDLYSLKKMLKGGNQAQNENTAKIVDERINYASAELGAKILQFKAEPPFTTNFFKTWMGMGFSTNPPIKMLRSGMEPGNCFAFKNDKADVTIQLAYGIYVDQIVLAHISRNQTPTLDTSSAPMDFRIYGIYGDFYEFSLGKYRFHNNPDELSQRYTVITNDRIEYLRFEFESNHGHPNYTCIYRIAVFGKL